VGIIQSVLGWSRTKRQRKDKYFPLLIWNVHLPWPSDMEAPGYLAIELLDSKIKTFAPSTPNLRLSASSWELYHWLSWLSVPWI
jgi:hypothetical protein